MTNRELALGYCRAKEAGMAYQRVGIENEIAERAGIRPMAMLGRRQYLEQIEAFVSRALAFNGARTRTVGVRFVEPPAGIVRPENPFLFVPHEVLAGDVGAMIVEGPVPIDPPDGWVVVLVHDREGKLLCTTVPPSDLELV